MKRPAATGRPAQSQRSLSNPRTLTPSQITRIGTPTRGMMQVSTLAAPRIAERICLTSPIAPLSLSSPVLLVSLLRLNQLASFRSVCHDAPGIAQTACTFHRGSGSRFEASRVRDAAYLRPHAQKKRKPGCTFWWLRSLPHRFPRFRR
jgi:hypothetical protein